MKTKNSRGHVLAIDIGNTNITFGVFSASKIVFSSRVETRRRTADETDILIEAILNRNGIRRSFLKGAAVASVVPHATASMIEALRRGRIRVMDVNEPAVRNSVQVEYQPPSSVGADRLANAVAAHRLYPGKKCKIVVDFGTATTFDCISPAGVYLGGVIQPGVEISAQSLFEKTAQLPQIDFGRVDSAVGKDTQSSIRAGLFFGVVGSVREILKELEKETGRAVRIGTGGLAGMICPAVGGFDDVDVELTLKGIKFMFDQFSV